MILRAIISAGIACLPAVLAPAVAAQEPPALLATSQYLFVVRGDWVYQYDVDTLVLRSKAQIPTGGQARGGKARPPKQLTERLPRAVEVIVEEPPAPPAQVTEEPNPTAVGLGGGAGGRFGARGGGRATRGASAKANSDAIQAGLKWLAAHQDENGRWDSDGFMKHDKGEATTGPGNPVHDVGATGLAMLAMLGDGSTLRSGPYKDNLMRGAKWLKEQQHNDGRFGTNASHDFIYDHAIATYAMCEAYGLSQYNILKKCAQGGINYLESHRNPYSVWRYQPRDNDNDISVTSWCLMACASGKFFKLQVNENALKLGATYLDQVSTPNGRHGYTKAGERSSRQPGKHATIFPVDKCETLTAAGLFCRYFLGQDPKQKPIMKAAADLIVAKPPKWSKADGTIDFYYWYYGTYAMFQAGGKHWRTWNKHLITAVTKNQNKYGNAAGSWDPIGVWGDVGGRVCSTALSVLSLEASYRYTRLVR